MKLINFFLFIVLLYPSNIFSQETFILEYGELNIEEAPFSIIVSETGNFYSGIYKQNSNNILSRILKINNRGIVIAEKELENKRLLGIKEIDTGSLFCYGINETNNSKPFFFLILNDNLDIVLNRNYGINDNSSDIDIYRSRCIKKNDTIHCFYTFSGRPAYVFSVNTNCDSLKSFEYDFIYDICDTPDKNGYVLTGHFPIFPGYFGQSRVAFANENLEIYKVKDIDLGLHSYFFKFFVENSEKNIIFNGTDIAHLQKDQIGFSTFDTTMTNVYTSIVGNPIYENNIAFYDGLKLDEKFNIYTFSTINNKGGIPYLDRDNWLMLTKADSMQNIIWEKYYGGDAFYQAYNFALTNDGGIILAATKFDNEIGLYDNVFIFKTDSNGNALNVVGINEISNNITHELIIYPNPSTTNLNIRTTVQVIGGEFKMYDVSGKQVIQQKITQSITQINTNNLPAGTYIYSYVHKGKKIESGKWLKE